jgi:hypothetical protein
MEQVLGTGSDQVRRCVLYRAAGSLGIEPKILPLLGFMDK